MTKEISFIVEFDELNDEQLKDLINYLDDNSIKHHVLKSNYQLLKEENYKQALIKIREFINSQSPDAGVSGKYILEIIDKYLEKSDKE